MTRGKNGSQVRPDSSRRGERRSQARRPRDPLSRAPDAVAPARRGQRPFQGTRPGRHLDFGHCGGRGRVSEPDHLLLPHQGSAVRRSRLPRRAVCGARGRAGCNAGPDAAGLHPRTGRDRHRDGFGRPLYRSAHAHPPPPGSRAAGGTHHRAAAWRGDARLCRPDRTARLEEPARSRRQLTPVLGAGHRRDGRGPCRGPIGRGNLRVLGDQATTSISGDNTRLRLVGDRDASDSDSPDGEGSS